MIGAMLSEALYAMGANRLRTFLTMLGMMIGVGAVVLMTAIGQGAQFVVDESIAAMGSNLFIVLSGSTTSGGVRMGGGAAPTLTATDAEALAGLPAISAVAPMQPGTAQVVYGPNNWSTGVSGTLPSYLDVRAWRIAAGYPFTDSDVRSATRVALLGQTVVKNLFGDEDPVGKTIRIRQSPFVVVGVLAAKGQSLNGQDQDDTIIIPLTTAQRKLFGSQFPGTVRYIMVQATSPESMPAAQKEMTQLLRQRHHIREGADADFDVRNLTAVANTAAETSRVMTMMLGAIASISLLVGGIGIMNIMLVSVTERTREIGIRLAIGALEREVLLQFLIEAVVLSGLGGLLGVAIATLASIGLASLMGVPYMFDSGINLLSLLFSAGIGVVFGYFPARRAASLVPIDALRYE
jgi:putative ABC transport system permease protein